MGTLLLGQTVSVDFGRYRFWRAVGCVALLSNGVFSALVYGGRFLWRSGHVGTDPLLLDLWISCCGPHSSGLCAVLTRTVAFGPHGVPNSIAPRHARRSPTGGACATSRTVWAQRHAAVSTQGPEDDLGPYLRRHLPQQGQGSPASSCPTPARSRSTPISPRSAATSGLGGSATPGTLAPNSPNTGTREIIL